MFEDFTHLPIVVEDQDRALEFYTGTLGFVKVQDSQQKGRPRWLTVANPGRQIEYILVKGEYVSDPRSADGHHLTFPTSACRGEVAKLRARGVAFREPAPVETPSGILAEFADPDGNRMYLAEARAGDGDAEGDPHG
jgi:catechol 2,3-dioxygenase-like lactoylglutathione lyase family enzyme